MKFTTTPILIALVFLPLGLKSSAQTQFILSTNNGAITIAAYTGSHGVVTVPSTIASLPVTAIGDWAFYATGVTNVLIPDSVTNIGDGAFFDCQSLTNVTIGSSVGNIGDWTFAFCPRLASVCCRGNPPYLGGDNVFFGNAATIYYLPATVGWGTMFDGHPAVLWNPQNFFEYAVANDAVTITGYWNPYWSPDLNWAMSIPSTFEFLPVVAIGDSALDGFGDGLNAVIVPDGVTSIGAQTFSYDGTTNIVIPDSVTNIGWRAFYNCRNLASIAIPTNMTSLGTDAFYGSGLRSVTIPNSVTDIGGGAFMYCYGLTNVTIPNSVKRIGDYAFAMCNGLQAVTIPDGVTSIGNDVFDLCMSLVSVTIPDGVTSMGTRVFFACPSLASITIPHGLTSVGDQLCIDCVSLTNVVIPNTVTSIGSLAFSGCGLASVTVADGVTNIGAGAFSGCRNLSAIAVGAHNPRYSSVSGVLFSKNQTVLVQCPAGIVGGYSIPAGVTRIEDYGFGSCGSLATISIPDTVTNIGVDAFVGCLGLTNIVIPDSVTDLGDAAFAYCSNLVSVMISKNIDSIGFFDFGDCPSLSSVFFDGDAPSFAHQAAFYDDGSVTAYYLPGTAGWDATFDGVPTAPWLPQMQAADSGLARRKNSFGFNINWARGQTVVVEACTNMANPAWQPFQTNTLATGSDYFSDSLWTNSPSRFYRLHAP